MLHVQMAALAEYMRSAIRGGDIETAGRVLSFLEKSLRLERAISEIANAIALSFVKQQERFDSLIENYNNDRSH